MTKSYKLILESGPNSGTEYPLEKDELYLGRDVNNDVVINDAEVSRRHARLVRQGDDYYFEDMGSTNGTFILGQRLSSPTLLLPNAKITIGEKVQISYIAESIDPTATVVAQRRMEMPVQRPPVVNVFPVQPAPTPPIQSAPPPSYTPPVYSTPAVPPMMSSAQPVYANYPGAQMPPKKKSKAGIILLIILGVILVFCMVPWIIIEITNSYCALFPGIFNMLQAGSCL